MVDLKNPFLSSFLKIGFAYLLTLPYLLMIYDLLLFEVQPYLINSAYEKYTTWFFYQTTTGGHYLPSQKFGLKGIFPSYLLYFAPLLHPILFSSFYQTNPLYPPHNAKSSLYPNLNEGTFDPREIKTRVLDWNSRENWLMTIPTGLNVLAPTTIIVILKYKEMMIGWPESMIIFGNYPDLEPYLMIGTYFLTSLFYCIIAIAKIAKNNQDNVSLIIFLVCFILLFFIGISLNSGMVGPNW